MDYEKAYKDAIARAKAKMEESKTFDYDDEQTAHTIRLTTTDIFPELADSEDEKIRKSLLKYLKDMCKNTRTPFSLDNAKLWIAWLEKQGEQKLPIEELPKEMKTIGESLGFTTQEECDKYNEIVSELIMSDEKQDEQKPQKKSKRKHRMGD